MRLNLKNIIHVPGATLPFDFQLDLSEVELNGQMPISEPVTVSGRVRNMASALVLEAEANTRLHLICDRCSAPFTSEMWVPMETLLAAELADEASEDEILPLDGDVLDMGEAATTAVILAMDSKNLCSEDCKGICPGCGVNLNEEACRCKPEVDPRLADLAQLLEDKTSE